MEGEGDECSREEEVSIAVLPYPSTAAGGVDGDDNDEMICLSQQPSGANGFRDRRGRRVGCQWKLGFSAGQSLPSVFVNTHNLLSRPPSWTQE